MSAFPLGKPFTEPTAASDHSIMVQHAVVVRTPDHLRKLNELLAVGWRVLQSAPFEAGAVLLVIEAAGDPNSVEEFRQVFGAPAGCA